MSHFYADDSQLFLYCHQTRFNGCKSVVSVDFIGDIGLWMKSYRLRVNPSKTEFVWLATSCRLRYFDDSPFDGQHRCQANHHGQKFVCRDEPGLFHEGRHWQTDALKQSCFCLLRQIWTIRRSLTFDAARTIVCSLINSCVDYCNYLCWSSGLFTWLSEIYSKRCRSSGMWSTQISPCNTSCLQSAALAANATTHNI